MSVNSSISGSQNGFVTQTGSETLQNKTDVAPKVNSYQDVQEVAGPATPASGYVRVYAKNDKKLYRKGSDGIESSIGSGSGSGGINYIANQDFEDGTTTGWVAYDDGAVAVPADGQGGSPTVISISNSASSPIRGTRSFLIIKSAANGQGEGTSYNLTLDPADLTNLMTISFDYAISGTYTIGDLGVYVVADPSGTPILLTPSNVDLYQTNGVNSLNITFPARAVTNYNLVIHQRTTTANAYTMKMDNVRLGPDSASPVPNIQDDIAYSASVSNITTDQIETSYSLIGNVLTIHYLFEKATGAGSGTTPVGVSIPPGFTPAAGHPTTGAATWFRYETGVALALAPQLSGNEIIFKKNGIASPNNFLVGNDFFNTGAPPNTYDNIYGVFQIVVNESSAGLYSANTTVDYAFNFNNNDADNTTDFAYGSEGVQFGNFTVNRSKRVRFRTPIRPTDMMSFQFSLDFGQSWLDLEFTANNIAPYSNQNGTEYGVILTPTVGTTTDLDVNFSQYRAPAGGAYAAVGQTYSGISLNGQYLWRVVKSSNPIGVGFNTVKQHSAGLVESAGQLQGTNLPDEALPGKVGEFLTDTVASYSIATTNSYYTPISVDFTGIQPGEFVATLNSTFYQNGATWTTASDFLSGLSYAANSLPSQQFGLNATFDSCSVSSTVDYASSSLSGVRIFWDGTNITIHNVLGSGAVLYGVAYADHFVSGNPLAYLNLNVRRVR